MHQCTKHPGVQWPCIHKIAPHRPVPDPDLVIYHQTSRQIPVFTGVVSLLDVLELIKLYVLSLVHMLIVITVLYYYYRLRVSEDSKLV